MTDTNFSGGDVLWETDDNLDEGNIAKFAARANETDYVERGCGFTLSGTTLTVGNTNTRGNFIIIQEDKRAYFLFPDQTDLTLVDSDVNHIYAAYDRSGNQGYFHHDTADSAPSDPSVKIGKADTNADTVTELNRNAAITASSINSTTRVRSPTDSTVQTAIDNANAGDHIIVEGDFTVNSAINIDERLNIDIYGDVSADADAFQIGHNASTKGLELRVHGAITGQGNSDGNTAFNIETIREGVIEWYRIGGNSNNSGNGIQRGIYLHGASNNGGPVDSTFYGRKIRDVTTAIDIHAENDIVQGHTFHDFPIFDTTVSVKARGANAVDLNSFLGVTLHGHTAARNTDEVDETGSGIGNTYILDFVGSAYPNKYNTLDGTLITAGDGPLLIGNRDVQGRTPGDSAFNFDASTNIDFKGRDLFNINIVKGNKNEDMQRDIPFDSNLSQGTRKKNSLSLDGTGIVQASAESDGSGGIQNAKVFFRNSSNTLVYENDANGNHNFKGGDLFNIGNLKGVPIENSAPAAGNLSQGEIRYGNATGPNSRDEIFWSVDGSTVARVEADSEIT